MEQGRLFLAIVLSLLVFIVWSYLFGDLKEPQKNEAQPAATQTIKDETDHEKENRSDFKKEAVTEPAMVTPDETATNRKPRIIAISSSLYKVKISEAGAVVNSFVLNNYKENIEKNSKLKEMISQDIKQGTAQTGFLGNAAPGIEKAIFMSNVANDNIIIDENEKTICFSWKSSDGIKIEKKYTFFPNTYLINLSVTIINESVNAIDDSFSISLINPYSDKKSSIGFEGPCVLIDNKLAEIKIKKTESKKEFTGNIKWIAVQDRYFISSIIPTRSSEARMLVSVSDGMEKTEIITPKQELIPGREYSYAVSLYFGPKSVETLKTVGSNLDKAVDFGWFDFLAKIALIIMNFLYQYIPNYGIAIIILTLGIKIILWPLGTKSYKSMNEMKRLQPLMSEIREKYKNDKKKMNEEIMGLYKTYKINPLGGCLPMFAQIPVFIAFYRMLYGAVELRHAPFFGWINDLSEPDRLFHFGFSIPFMQPPCGIPVLTIIMGATMLIQQKLSPPLGDPTQAKIMMLMPIIFTFIFINFSSGLVLYWLVNNVLSIVQQYYIMKKYK